MTMEVDPPAMEAPAKSPGEVTQAVHNAALDTEVAKHDEAIAKVKCMYCKSSDTTQGEDITGCFGCGKLYNHDELCCVAPHIVEDELGLSCENCGHSVNAATLKVSTPAAPIIEFGDLPDGATDTQDSAVSSETMLPCCNIPVSFAEIHDDMVHCLNCEQFHSTDVVFGFVNGKKDDDEAVEEPSGRSPCCRDPQPVRSYDMISGWTPNSDPYAKPTHVAMRCQNCGVVYRTPESVASEGQEAASSMPDNANGWVDAKYMQQLARGYDRSQDPGRLWKFEVEQRQWRINPVDNKDTPAKKDESSKWIDSPWTRGLTQNDESTKNDWPTEDGLEQEDWPTLVYGPGINNGAGSQSKTSASELAVDEDSESDVSDDRTFTLFQDFPAEIRDHIYKIVLRSDKAIAPHLCDQDHSAGIKFHDDNQVKHNAVYRSMHITRVSRKVRAESLPIFYSVNTFEVVADTPIYLLRLQHLGRFDMIHHVDFVLPFWSSQDYSQKVLRMLLQNLADQEKYENPWSVRVQMLKGVVQSGAGALIESVNNKLQGTMEAIGLAVKDKTEDSADAPRVVPYKRDPSKFHTDSLYVLKSHPLHIMGGLEPGFLVLRMLSMTLKGEEYNRKLVIHVPAAEFFDQYNGLLYFPAVCEGLGIQLKFVSGREPELVNGGIRLSWHRKYQKKAFTDNTTAQGGAEEYKSLVKRVQALYPNIEKVSRPSKRTYYRRLCDPKKIEWFSVDTEGGGLS